MWNLRDWSSDVCSSDLGDIKKLNYSYLDDENNGFINHVKPFLRTLYDLTNEIEIDGVKFVPIVELLKIKHKKWYDENVGLRYSDIEFESVPNYAKACFSFQALNSIEVWYKNLELEPYWIIQKLLSWHFDVFGLIEKKLAIDINTLES
jgi:hypothetical protein